MNRVYFFTIALLLTFVSCGPSEQEKEEALDSILSTNSHLLESKVKYSITPKGVQIHFINGSNFSNWGLYGEVNLSDSAIVFSDTCNSVNNNMFIPINIEESLLSKVQTMSFEGRPLYEKGERVIVRPDAYLFYSRGAKDSTLTVRKSDREIRFKINLDRYRKLPDDTRRYCYDEILSRHKIDLEEYL